MINISLQMLSRQESRYFELTHVSQFILWLALILSIKFDTLFAPPVWDTAMGIFPSAIFLYETGFDLLELIKQPDWWEGGQYVNAFSLWSWFVAVVMSVFDSPTITFATLHIITFMVNALAISVFVRTIYQYGISTRLALMSGLYLLLLPLVLVQIGYMYTESLVMSLSVLSWAHWHNKRETRAVLFALIAIVIKLTGAVIALCLVPLLILRLVKEFSYKRVLLLISLPLTFYTAISAGSWLGRLPPMHGMSWGSWGVVFNQLQWRLSATPEITNFIYLGALAAICYTVYQWRLSPNIHPVRLLYQHSVENGSQIIALFYTFVFAAGIIVMSFNGYLFLHRYAVPMIPFAIIQLVLFAQVLRFQRVLSFLFILGCLLSIYNHSGALYKPVSAFSVVEASHAYKSYNLAQKTIIAEVEKLGDDVPIYVSREIDYMMSHPMMGYLTEIKPNIIGIYKPQYARMTIDDFPDEFYAVITNPGHGGGRLRAAITKAKRADGWKIDQLYRQKIGGYNMYISRILKTTKVNRTNCNKR